MLGRVVVENGVKKIVPLTADCGSGNPVGTVIAVYSNKVPNGYLPCNGVAFDTAQFPVLYALLGDDHTPDLRECTLKGIGESGRTVGAHVKAGGLAVGEFIDDRIQEHSHSIRTSPVTSSGSSTGYTYASGDLATIGNATEARAGATTEVKAVGVNFCIKATSGINENQADNVLSALTPVNEVTADNLHSVTSNAVYEAIGEWETLLNAGGATVLGLESKNGKYLQIHFDDYPVSSSGASLLTLPAKYRPSVYVQRFYIVYNYPNTKASFCNIYDNGDIKIYGEFSSNTIIYGDAIVRLL